MTQSAVVTAQQRQADERVVLAVQRRQRAEADEVAALLEARALGVSDALGFASFHEYAEARLGLTPRLAYERVRVVEALGGLPRLRAALASGAISYSAARELSRVATAANELVWLERAAGCNVREIERLVAGRPPGSDPDDEPDPEQVTTPVRFELSAATRALLREAQQQLRRDAGQRLDDDAFVAELVRRALAGSAARKPGAPSYQIAINVCDRCERVTQNGAGQVVDLDPSELRVALCDASVIDTGRRGGKLTREVPAATRAAVVRRDHGRCKVPGCRNAAWVDLHHQVYRSQDGDHDPGNLLLLCTAHHHAVHEDRLIITRHPRGYAFHHADGTVYGVAPAPAGAAAPA